MMSLSCPFNLKAGQRGEGLVLVGLFLSPVRLPGTFDRKVFIMAVV